METGEKMSMRVRVLSATKKLTFAVAGLLGSLAIADRVGAATIVDWKPGPTTPAMPEFTWTGSQLQDSIGAHSSGDGTLPPNQQVGGGLNMETPFVIPGVPGSSIDAVAGTTTFFDSTLHLT